MASLLVGCAQAPAPQRPPAAWKGTIVAFGDSLSAGLGLEEEDAYPAQLQRRLEQDGYHWQVVNAGLSGETSTGALGRLDWVMRLKPSLVILETGANDGLRGQSPQAMEHNLTAIIDRLKQAHVTVLLTGMQALQNLGETYSRRFAAVFPRVAAREQVPLMPFFLQDVAGVPLLNQADRLHPTREGYAKIVNHLAPQLEAMLKKTP